MNREPLYEAGPERILGHIARFVLAAVIYCGLISVIAR